MCEVLHMLQQAMKKIIAGDGDKGHQWPAEPHQGRLPSEALAASLAEPCTVGQDAPHDTPDGQAWPWQDKLCFHPRERATQLLGSFDDTCLAQHSAQKPHRPNTLKGDSRASKTAPVDVSD